MNALKVEEFGADSLLTSYQAGTLLQVNPSSVNKWVKDGRIPAFRTPGGHRRIRAADLVAFLTEHKMPIPPVLSTASRRRVLIVEHDVTPRETLQRAALSLGERLEIVCVDNGVDAMVQVGAFRPHLIVLDAQMPQFDWFEVCRRLHNSRDTANIQVIVASQTLSEDLHQRSRDCGARACVHKPVDLTILLRELGLSAPLTAA